VTGLRQKHRAGRERRILSAAREAFCERGYASSTIEEIAARAEVSSVTVFNYYRSKGSVLLAVVAESDRLLLEKIDVVLAAPPDDPVEAVVAFAQTILEHAFTTLTPEVWANAVATALSEGASEFGRGYRELDRKLVRRLASLVATLAARGRMRPRHGAQTVAEVLYNLYNARFVEFAADPGMSREAAAALTRRDLTLVVETMRVRA
jgi:AcrR family transcriptional regulator